MAVGFPGKQEKQDSAAFGEKQRERKLGRETRERNNFKVLIGG